MYATQDTGVVSRQCLFNPEGRLTHWSHIEKQFICLQNMTPLSMRFKNHIRFVEVNESITRVTVRPVQVFPCMWYVARLRVIPLLSVHI